MLKNYDFLHFVNFMTFFVIDFSFSLACDRKIKMKNKKSFLINKYFFAPC